MSLKETLISLKIKAENLLSKDADDASQSLETLQGKSKALRSNLKLLEDQKSLIKQFQSQQAAVDKNTIAYTQLSERAVTLRKRIDETGDPTGQFAVQLERTEAAAKKSAAALLTKTTALNKVKTGLDKANIDTNNLTKEEKQLASQVTKTKSALGKFATQMRSLGNETETTEAKSKNFSFVKAAYWTGGVIGITTLFNKIKTLGVEMLTTGDKFEGLRIQMDALMGSVEAGEQATEWIKTFTQNTPLQLEEVTETFARLKSYGLDPMDGTMQAIVDASEKLGGGMERVEGISLALGQAWAKQKLQGEEILQLVERGVPVWDLLEKATGRNTLELQKLSTQGKLGRDVIKQLTVEIGKSAEGAAAANMGRLSGIVSNLKDQYQIFLDTVAKSGALDYAKEQLSLLNATVKEMAADGSLKAWAQRISDSLVSFVEGVKSASQWLYKFKDAIVDVGAAALKIKLAQMFLGFGVAATKAVASLFAVQGAMTKTAAVSATLTTALKVGLAGALTFTATQIYRVVDAYQQMNKAESAAQQSAELAKQTTIEKEAKLKALSKQIGINITSMKQFLSLEEKGTIVFDDATQSYRLSNDALAEQTQRQKQNAQVMNDASIPTVERLKIKFEALQRSGVDATTAIGELVESMDVDNTDSIQAVVDSLEILKTQGQITADQIETGLRLQLKNLDDKELAALKENAPDTFDALGVSIKSIVNDVDPLRAQFTALGLDLNALRGGFTETGQTALTAFSSISTSATASSNEIVSAFDAVLTKLSTTSEVEMLRAKIEKLGADGKVSGQQLSDMLDNLTIKSATVTPGINAIEEAFDSLGVESQSSLALTAESLRKSYELIKANTTSIDDKKAAFIAYAKAAIAANDGVISSEISMQAAVLGVSEQLKSSRDSVVTNIIQGGAVISESTQKTTDDFNAERQAMDETAESSGTLKKRFQVMADTTDVSAFSLSELEAQLQKVEARMESNGNVLFGWRAQLARTQTEFDKQTVSVIEQTIKLRELEAALDATETPSQALISRTESSIKSLEDLDATQLTNLYSQIDTAKEKLEDLETTAKSTLSSVQDELDTLNGNDEAVEQRELASKLADLDEQLAEAEASNSKQAIADIEKAIQLTKTLYAQKIDAIRAEKAEAETASDSSSDTNTETTSSSTEASETTKSVNLTLNIGGETVTVPTTEAGSEDLLSLLTKNALVTA
ncbi:tape measure protein [Psychromonas sp. PT13]|uniref:tape measure protein n=1 Tax=Psychromonas sp. PT13 TaxID=3439547 RepID=UPI003EBCB044